AMTIPLATKGQQEPPLLKLEHALVTPVNFLIVPLFALANTAIRFEEGMLEGLISPLGIGIIVGLMLGKPVGVYLMTKLAILLRIGSMPEGASWAQIIGVGLLAGIGFTMSIFIALLSFSDNLLIAEAKFSILVASLLSGVTGDILLSRVAPPSNDNEKKTSDEEDSVTLADIDRFCRRYPLVAIMCPVYRLKTICHRLDQTLWNDFYHPAYTDCYSADQRIADQGCIRSQGYRPTFWPWPAYLRYVYTDDRCRSHHRSWTGQPHAAR